MEKFKFDFKHTLYSWVLNFQLCLDLNQCCEVANLSIVRWCEGSGWVTMGWPARWGSAAFIIQLGLGCPITTHHSFSLTTPLYTVQQYLIVSDMPTFWTKSVYDCLVPNIFFSLYWLTSQLTHTCAYSPGLIFISLMQGLCNISQQGLFGICSGRKIIQSDHRFCIERTTI